MHIIASRDKRVRKMRSPDRKKIERIGKMTNENEVPYPLCIG